MKTYLEAEGAPSFVFSLFSISQVSSKPALSSLKEQRKQQTESQKKQPHTRPHGPHLTDEQFAKGRASELLNRSATMGDMNYSLTTFNKSGKLLQIEYALNRVAQGKMALGIKATNGVVIAADKKVASVLVDADDYQKIQNITPSTGFVYAGMVRA